MQIFLHGKGIPGESYAPGDYRRFFFQEEEMGLDHGEPLEEMGSDHGEPLRIKDICLK